MPSDTPRRGARRTGRSARRASLPRERKAAPPRSDDRQRAIFATELHIPSPVYETLWTWKTTAAQRDAVISLLGKIRWELPIFTALQRRNELVHGRAHHSTQEEVQGLLSQANQSVTEAVAAIQRLLDVNAEMWPGFALYDSRIRRACPLLEAPLSILRERSNVRIDPRLPGRMIGAPPVLLLSLHPYERPRRFTRPEVQKAVVAVLHSFAPSERQAQALARQLLKPILPPARGTKR